MLDATQCFLDPFAGGDRRVGHEAQRRRALQTHLAGDGGLELGPPSLERELGSLGQRSHENSSMTEIRIGADAGHGQEGQTVVVVAQPLERIAEYLN